MRSDAIATQVIEGGESISISRYQKELCKTFFALLDFLESKDIPYVLFYGTLLGAVREGGFISWDFDIDIAIKEDVLLAHIKDLDDFAAQIGSSFATYARGEYGVGLSRVLCPNLYVSRPSMKENPFGQAYIDIFAYREISVSPSVLKDHKKIRRRKLLASIKEDKDMPKNKFKALAKLLLRPFLPGNHSKWIRRCLDKSIWKKPGEHIVSLACLEEPLSKYPLITGRVYADFEGRRCFVPLNSEDFLLAEYGKTWVTPIDDHRSDSASFYILHSK